MGLITCPKCGKTISEKAVQCPHCKANISKPNYIICEDCNKEYDASIEVCPNCGCPNSHAILKKKKQKSKIICMVMLILFVGITLCVGILQKTKESEYYSNMETVSYLMLEGAAKAENVGNLIISVWHNAIYEEQDNETDQYTMKNGKFVDDFNDALSCLFTNEDFISSINEIETNQLAVTELMKQLNNPPKKYEKSYDTLKSYYDNYLKMTKAVINPTGSLNTFSEDFYTYDINTVDSYEKMKLYLK